MLIFCVPSVPSSSGRITATCGALAGVLLQLAAEQDVEGLIGAAELDVGADLDRVVRLHERIEELVDADRRAVAIALGEVVALEHARHGALRAETDHVLEAQRASHSPLKRTSVRSRSRILKTCSW